jgi:hypothetical protein
MKTKKQITQENRELRYSLEEVYGADNNPEGTILAFFKLFEEEGQEYTYIAQKINFDTWHCNGQYLSWTDLLFELDRDNLYVHDPSLIKIAPPVSEWETLSVEPPF